MLRDGSEEGERQWQARSPCFGKPQERRRDARGISNGLDVSQNFNFNWYVAGARVSSGRRAFFARIIYVDSRGNTDRKTFSRVYA